MSKHIFVFGSNLAGIHAAGAAAHARIYHNAQEGVGLGPTGGSYAIPTKSASFKVLGLLFIEQYVKDFLEYARKRPERIFDVTRIGCGLAGYKDEQIAPMFKDAPENCRLPHGWRDEY